LLFVLDDLLVDVVRPAALFLRLLLFPVEQILIYRILYQGAQQRTAGHKAFDDLCRRALLSQVWVVRLDYAALRIS
jgi:hypothetical protein